MQIVSHMDSLDNHKVQEGLRREKEIKSSQGKESLYFECTLCKKGSCFLTSFKLMP